MIADALLARGLTVAEVVGTDAMRAQRLMPFARVEGDRDLPGNVACLFPQGRHKLKEPRTSRCGALGVVELGGRRSCTWARLR
jgi:hypothetical protein